MLTYVKKHPRYSVFWTLLITVFLGHGILYFLSEASSNYYSYQSPVKIVKYIILIIGLVVAVLRSKCWTSIDFMPFFLSFLLAFFYFLAHSKFDDYIILINYCAPIFTVILYRNISDKVDLYGLIKAIYIFSSIIGYVEFLFLKGKFGIFADVGYRACSIFINPNNFGAFIFLSSSVLLTKSPHRIEKLLILANSYVLLGMSGSRSGLVMMSISVTLIYGYYLIKQLFSSIGKISLNINSVFLVGIVFITISTLLVFPNLVLDKISNLLSGGRRFGEIDLSVGRFYQINEFIKQIYKNPIFPNRNEVVYTDNIILHIWGFFGFPIMLLYIAFTIYIIYTLWHINKKRCLLMILLFLFGVFENYLYLWPIAYIYWYIAGTIFYRGKYTKSEYVDS